MTIPDPDVSAENPISDHWIWVGPHRPAVPRVLHEQMTRDWAVRPVPREVHPAATFTADRRARLAAEFPGKTLVIPTGGLKVRANDTDYRFRPGTDFFYLTACSEPDCVLVITPTAGGSRATLYVARRRDHQTHEFYTDARYGELWVGERRGVDEAAVFYDIETAPLEYLEKDLSSLTATDVLVVRGFDATVDGLVPATATDEQLTHTLSEMRLVKDDYEVAQLQVAIDATVRGFEDVVRSLPLAVQRGERVIEGIFGLRARVEGNDVGYSTIAASGANATVLHWIENDGQVREGDLLLLDAGIECNNLYTADVTRTLPITGKFSPAQRRLYDLVRRAHQAGIEAVAPGASFGAPHEAAMKVLAEGLVELGILTVSAEEALRRDKQLHRRYTLHGVSHMLGLDVHDCAHARDEVYRGTLEVGYVLTVEPGLYFQPNDLTVPEEYRGIGIRIEDDVLVTPEGRRVLSNGLPVDADAIEAWMADQFARGVPSLGL